MSCDILVTERRFTPHEENGYITRESNFINKLPKPKVFPKPIMIDFPLSVEGRKFL